MPWYSIDVPGERLGHPRVVDAVAEADVIDGHRGDAETVLLVGLPGAQLEDREAESVRYVAPPRGMRSIRTLRWIMSRLPSDR